MYFVYFLRSESNPTKTYIGYTSNLVRRMQEHNEGDNQNSHTWRFRPWAVQYFILAETEEVAGTAEAYFKNSSGQEKFRNFASAHPAEPNPIKAFFESQNAGRIFGRSSFKVSDSKILMSCS